MTLAVFAAALMNFCDATGGSVERHIETPARARQRTGAEHCPHLYGVGADIVYDVPLPLAEAMKRADTFGLRLERGFGYDHVEPQDWRPGYELPTCVAITVAIRKPGDICGRRVTVRRALRMA